MMFVYILIGFVAAVLAAAPPGAANIVVINTAVKENMRKVLYLALGAGLGELALSLIALHCTMNFFDFFESNPWVQITTFSLFILVGTYFIFQNKLPKLETTIKKPKAKTSKFMKGFLLAVLNPPVLIYWVLAFTALHQFTYMVSDMSAISTLILFFAGVYLGKTATLYFYGRWGSKLGQNKNEKSSKKEIFIGSALLIVGLIQGVKFFI